MAAVACAAVVGLGTLAGVAGAAVADPVPRPGHQARHQPPPSHTVVRCQHDDTDQTEEIAGDGEDEHDSADWLPTLGSDCPRTGNALKLYRLTAGQRHPRVAAGPAEKR
jgi:hypothetical protein